MIEDDGESCPCDLGNVGLRPDDGGGEPWTTALRTCALPDGDRQVDPGLASPFSKCEQYLRWPSHIAESFARSHPELYRGALALVRSTSICVSTHYSGVDFFSIALEHVIRALACHGEASGRAPFKVYHVADTDPACRSALLRHHGNTRAEHVFGDITSRFGPDAKSRADELQATTLATFKAGMSQSSGGPVPDREAMSRRLCAELQEIFAAAPLQSHDWCYRHKGQCKLMMEEGGEPRLLVNCAGSCCYDFTAHGLHHGWLGSSSPPFFAWLEERVRMQEDIVIHESGHCHPGCEIIKKRLSPTHIVESIVLSPKELGVPSHRPRRFTWCIKRAKLMTAEARAIAQSTSFVLHSLRAVPTATGTMFFVAPPGVLRTVLRMWRERQRKPRATWLQLLSPGDRERCRSYGRHLRYPDINICDITQHLAFVSFDTYRFMPSMTRKCVLWCFEEKRALLPQEMFLVLGVAPWACREEPGGVVRCELPFACKNHSLREMRSMCGNGVNTYLVGAIFFQCLAAVGIPLD